MTHENRDMNRRWDGDTQGHGIANGMWIAPSVAELQGALAQPDWVAEDPEHHLLPHLRQACETAGSPWRLTGTEFQDGVYVVDLEWTQAGAGQREVRAALYGLVGEIAEGTTFVRQVASGAALEYHVTTGLLPGDTDFASHGHLLRFRITRNT